MVFNENVRKTFQGNINYFPSEKVELRWGFILIHFASTTEINGSILVWYTLAGQLFPLYAYFMTLFKVFICINHLLLWL